MLGRSMHLVSSTGRWFVLQIQKSEIEVVAESGSEEQDHEQAFKNMKTHLSNDNSCYVVIKLLHESLDGRGSECIGLLMWHGSKTKTKEKMLYAATCSALKSAILHKTYHEFDNLGELTYQSLVRCK